MAKNKRKTIERILANSKAPEPVKQSFLRAYAAAHNHKKKCSKPGGGF